MPILGEVAASGWTGTEWVALISTSVVAIGSLVGVWLGKRLERATQSAAREETILLDQTRALKAALTQVELLVPNIDPTFMLRKISAGLPLPGVAAMQEAENVSVQHERLETLLIEASMHGPNQEVDDVLQRLRIQVREAVVCSVALLAEVARGTQDSERATILRGQSSQRVTAIQGLGNALRSKIQLGPTQLSVMPQEIEDLRSQIMEDRRVVETPDVLSRLEEDANLMDLTPAEFEALVANLFAKMGLGTSQTVSHDSGVDILAVDSDPISGGKVIIVAKRYSSVVATETVRSLFATVVSEQAARGILVTTSDFGRASYEFARGKPIELLSGSNLLYLLDRYAGVKARIEAPRWRIERS
jgi:hypothetical protein